MDNQVKAGFTAANLVCHPDGAIFLALSEKGLVSQCENNENKSLTIVLQVQCFDTALTPIQLCFPNEEQVTLKYNNNNQGTNIPTSKFG